MNHGFYHDGSASDSLTLLLCRMLLQHCFRQQRSTQVAVVHCSAQTSPSHVLQKLGQMCMVISSNTGRVYRPKDCDRLILYLKDLNLPKPDKWGTSQLIAFLHQVLSQLPLSMMTVFCFLIHFITVAVFISKYLRCIETALWPSWKVSDLRKVLPQRFHWKTLATIVDHWLTILISKSSLKWLCMWVKTVVHFWSIS